MDVARRIYLSRLTEKIDKNREYAKRIGTKEKSKFVINKKRETEGKE